MTSTTSAKDLIKHLSLSPHPEGGWYRETWRDSSEDGRGRGSLIYYLLEKGQRSHWHRVDASEIWIYQGGGTLRLHTWKEGDKSIKIHELGTDLASGQLMQVVVEPFEWQAAEIAETDVDWVLVSCSVLPGFSFSGFEMAPQAWTPHTS